MGSPTVGALEQLAPSWIVLVGGTAALSAGIETELDSLLADTEVERLAGTDRFDTAARAARLAQLPSGRPVVIANGQNPASVGIAAPLAATLRGSVLFSGADRLGTAASDALKLLRPVQIVLIGSHVELADSVAAEVRELRPVASVTRISGVDRLDTAARAAVYGQTPTAERDDVDTIAANVRVLYAVPADREFVPRFEEFVRDSMLDVQSWWGDQLGGLSFLMHDRAPQRCRLARDADYYSRWAWERVTEDLQACAAVQHGDEDHDWIVFVDVDPACAPDGTVGNYEDGYDQLYRGGDGLAIMNYSSQDAGFENMLMGKEWTWTDCDEGPFLGTVAGTVSGMAHEIGHTFGLPHPPGCDDGLPTCDFDALMHLGTIPDTYLRPDEKELLIRSPFMNSQRAIAADPTHSVRVSGTVRNSNGQPAKGARVSLASDSFWSWATADDDGAFEISLASGAVGSASLSVHAHDTAPCRWLGYHSPSGLTGARENATSLDIDHNVTAGITVTLPSGLDDICDQRGTISGTLTGPDGNPVEGILIWAWNGNEVESGFAETAADGTFAISVAAGTFEVHVYAARDGSCAVPYDGHSVTADWSKAHLVDIAVAGTRDIAIQMSTLPDNLEGLQC